MSKSKRLVFFGTEDFSVPTLEKLIQDGWNIAAVVTKPDSRGGRGQKLITPKVKELAKKHGINVLQPAKVDEINNAIAKIKPDFGILVAYGKIIPQSTIDLFPGGIINVHPSLLPKYRGPSPIEAAILNGDTETGVSLMRLSAGMDEGPVYEQKLIALTGTETKPDLYDRLAKEGAGFLADKLEAIAEGWLTPKPQTDSQATYTKLLKKEDGRMEFNRPAEEIERQIRAYIGWPKSPAKLFDQDVIITKARVAHDENDGKLVIKCQPGYLDIVELIGPSGKTMQSADFLRGYKK